MTINGLLAAAGLNGTNELPIWNGATQKVTAQQLANAVKTLAALPNTTEMNAAIAQATAKYSSESAAQYITRSDGSTENNGRIVRFGNVVTIQLTLAGVSLAAGENTVATLSKAYPTWAGSAGYPTACGFIGAGSAIGTPVRCTLDTNGVLKVYASAAITSTLRVTFCYGTGDSAFE